MVSKVTGVKFGKIENIIHKVQKLVKLTRRDRHKAFGTVLQILRPSAMLDGNRQFPVSAF